MTVACFGVAAADMAVACSELGTSTDDSAVARQTPVSIKFTPSLTYAEKLLLKKNRRMELPMHGPLSTSRSCDSVIESDHRVPGKNGVDSPTGCAADGRSELVLDCNNSNRGMCPSV